MLVGLLIGVFFAPYSGEETRRKFSRKASGLKDSIEDIYDNNTDKVSNQERILQPKV
jgi:gas vesicle protein